MVGIENSILVIDSSRGKIHEYLKDANQQFDILKINPQR
jgi:hypothetical protein